ncbi:AAA family ATPase [Hymenobacter sp. HSC-4F20]|uniref:AAA family ATPase n=1 Tax=Hymenobacter sp. HSC-4F20 TaxID=2864135 RepID=UPI0038F786AD
MYTNQSGELTVEKDGSIIPIPQLSSGEKQLIILLTETLLQRNQPFIFLADEPELSLHIEWQAQVISSIKQLNPKSQIIVATHSPEITSGWINNVLQMESVVTNGKS